LVPLSSAVLLVAGGALLAAVGGLPLVCANATFDRTNPALSAASNRQLLAIVDLQFFLKSKIKEQSWFPALAIKSSGFRANCARLSMGETSAGISRPVGAGLRAFGQTGKSLPSGRARGSSGNFR
jgi:hypothetical protein